MEISELKTMIEERQTRRQAVMAIFLGVAILGVFVIIMPRPSSPKESPAMAVATTTPPNAFADVPMHAKAAIVYDLSTGETIFAKNSEAQLPLASLTKLLSLYAASKTLSPSSTVTITPTAIAQDGEYGLKSGEQFSFTNLAKFTLVSSSNDGAEAITEAAAQKEAISNSALLANAASAAGLTQTYALNGTGLDESTTVSGGYGSAHDVAVLAGKLLSVAPDIASATIQPSVTVSSLDGTVHTEKNTNQDVPRLPRLLLSKTGYTDLAGGNLVIIFDAGLNHPVAIAVLGSTRDARFTDVDTLVAATTAHFSGVSTSQP
jgi:D-alanyl-D-alanine carboxypeptidase (penicillin-binding protein 5/6)